MIGEFVQPFQLIVTPTGVPAGATFGVTVDGHTSSYKAGKMAALPSIPPTITRDSGNVTIEYNGQRAEFPAKEVIGGSTSVTVDGATFSVRSRMIAMAGVGGGIGGIGGGIKTF